MHILEDGPIAKLMAFISVAIAEGYCFDGSLEVTPIVWRD
jgi:hypothetical protein